MTERLIADIGGTNARFALADDNGAIHDERTLSANDFAGLADAVRAYLGGRRVATFVVAVATPVDGDMVRFTNNPWTFSTEAARLELGLERLVVINDFVAQAMAVMKLRDEDTRFVRAMPGRPGRPVIVIGPGTGLGVAILLPQASGGYLPLASEGGHASFASQDAEDDELLGELRNRFGHVSYERVVSGPGIVNVASALHAIAGRTLDTSDPAVVAERARAASCPQCVRTMQHFTRALGAIMGDLALTLLADRIYLVGGLCRRVADLVDEAAMTRSFLAKGRLGRMLEPVAILQTLRDDTGLAGVAAYDTRSG